MYLWWNDSVKLPGLARMKFILCIPVQVVLVHLALCGAIWIDSFYFYVPSIIQDRFSVVLGYATLILQALLYARHCYIGLLGMSNKQYDSQYRDNQLPFLLLDLLSYPFPSSPFKVWVYRGRGYLLGLWKNNTQYNESLSQNGTSRFQWGHLSGGSFEKTRKRVKKACEGWQT